MRLKPSQVRAAASLSRRLPQLSSQRPGAPAELRPSNLSELGPKTQAQPSPKGAIVAAGLSPAGPGVGVGVTIGRGVAVGVGRTTKVGFSGSVVCWAGVAATTPARSAKAVITPRRAAKTKLKRRAMSTRLPGIGFHRDSRCSGSANRPLPPPHLRVSPEANRQFAC